MNKRKSFFTPINLFVFLWILTFFYSFTQRDLNLTIYNIAFLQKFQDQLSYIGYFQRPASTLIALILIILIWIVFFIIIKQQKLISYINIKYSLLIISIFGIIAYPLFSHDIFNYIFNTKIILVYNKIPQLTPANQFMFDPWTRFMHNVHIPDPYGYGWTYLSAIPMILTIKNFTLSFWTMNTYVIFFYFLSIFIVYKISQLKFPKHTKLNVLLFAFNPFFILEIIYTGHNDNMMMAFALLSIYLLLLFDKTKEKNEIQKNTHSTFLILSSIFSFLLSISIKYATIILAPFFLLRKKIDFFTWGGLALLSAMLTKPYQVHSWYLIWGLSLLSLSKYKWVKIIYLLISIGGMFRYLPFIYYGYWNPPVPLIRNIILFVPLFIIFIPFAKKRLYQLLEQ